MRKSQSILRGSILGLMLVGMMYVPVYALTRTFTWEAPLKNVDGTPASVSGYIVYRSTDDGTTYSKITSLANATTRTWADPNVPTGNVCYKVSAFNTVGEGAGSIPVCFSVPTALPNAPTALSADPTVGRVTTIEKRP